MATTKYNLYIEKDLKRVYLKIILSFDITLPYDNRVFVSLIIGTIVIVFVQS